MTIEPSLALQSAIRARLISTADVTAMVAPLRIRDGGARPEDFPTILVGDGQIVMEGDHYPGGILNVTIHLDLHVWTFEAGLEHAKTITGEVWKALKAPLDVPGWTLSDGHHIEGARYLRDPSEQHGHAIISVCAFMSGVFE